MTHSTSEGVAALVARLRGLVGSRVVVRHRPDPRQRWVEDVLGTLDSVEVGADHDTGVVRVRRDRDGELVVVPVTALLAGKAVPPRPPRRRRGAGETDPETT